MFSLESMTKLEDLTVYFSLFFLSYKFAMSQQAISATSVRNTALSVENENLSKCKKCADQQMIMISG
jgi:hypothetical protein